jgi:uncharacterized membrane protein YfcA
MSTGLQALLLAGAGFLASVLNTVAGGGSFLTLPLLIFFGLPPGEANATNRVGVVAQGLSALVGFRRHGVQEWEITRPTLLPMLVGAGLGALCALQVGDRDLRRTLSILMVVVSLFALIGPERFRPAAHGRAALQTLGFLGVGFYGGFIQAGVGFLVLALTSLLGYDLVRGNVVKNLAVLAQTLLALAIFAWSGKVAWIPGLALAVGSVLGSQVGVRLTVLKGHDWLKRVVTATIVLFALKLWFDG